MTGWSIDEHVPIRVLVAVDDSPAALAAVDVAVALATRVGADLRFVNVVQDGELVAGLTTMGREGGLAERQGAAATAVLRHVAARARRAGVEADTRSVEGDPAPCILEQAAEWLADVVVVGRSDVRGSGLPYVGTVTRHVIEFSPRPVLVVPRPGR